MSRASSAGEPPEAKRLKPEVEGGAVDAKLQDEDNGATLEVIPEPHTGLTSFVRYRWHSHNHGDIRWVPVVLGIRRWFGGHRLSVFQRFKDRKSAIFWVRAAAGVPEAL